jgi:hypothetical protein
MLGVTALAYYSSYDNQATDNPTVKKEMIQIRKGYDK